MFMPPQPPSLDYASYTDNQLHDNNIATWKRVYEVKEQFCCPPTPRYVSKSLPAPPLMLYIVLDTVTNAPVGPAHVTEELALHYLTRVDPLCTMMIVRYQFVSNPVVSSDRDRDRDGNFGRSETAIFTEGF